jgi:uncharacterized protein with ParB-like and HNH nuclease domain
MPDSKVSDSDLHNIQRVMPRPWFRAHAFGSSIRSLRGEPDRALRSGERPLGRFILPPFQRPLVWTHQQQVRLIESIWSGLPIGAYVYNRAALDNACDCWLLDGQQRITAILAYMNGEFEVFDWRFTSTTVVISA